MHKRAFTYFIKGRRNISGYHFSHRKSNAVSENEMINDYEKACNASTHPITTKILPYSADRVVQNASILKRDEISTFVRQQPRRAQKDRKLNAPSIQLGMFYRAP